MPQIGSFSLFPPGPWRTVKSKGIFVSAALPRTELLLAEPRFTFAHFLDRSHVYTLLQLRRHAAWMTQREPGLSLFRPLFLEIPPFGGRPCNLLPPVRVSIRDHEHRNFKAPRPLRFGPGAFCSTSSRALAIQPRTGSL